MKKSAAILRASLSKKWRIISDLVADRPTFVDAVPHRIVRFGQSVQIQEQKKRQVEMCRTEFNLKATSDQGKPV